MAGVDEHFEKRLAASVSISALDVSSENEGSAATHSHVGIHKTLRHSFSLQFIPDLSPEDIRVAENLPGFDINSAMHENELVADISKEHGVARRWGYLSSHLAPLAGHVVEGVEASELLLVTASPVQIELVDMRSHPE